MPHPTRECVGGILTKDSASSVWHWWCQCVRMNVSVCVCVTGAPSDLIVLCACVSLNCPCMEGGRCFTVQLSCPWSPTVLHGQWPRMGSWLICIESNDDFFFSKKIFQCHCCPLFTIVIHLLNNAKCFCMQLLQIFCTQNICEIQFFLYQYTLRCLVFFVQLVWLLSDIKLQLWYPLHCVLVFLPI